MQRQVPGPMLQLVYCPGLLHVQGHWLFLTGLKMTPIPNALLLMQVWLLLEVRCGFYHMEFFKFFSKLLLLVFLFPALARRWLVVVFFVFSFSTFYCLSCCSNLLVILDSDSESAPSPVCFS